MNEDEKIFKKIYNNKLKKKQNPATPQLLTLPTFVNKPSTVDCVGY